MSEDKKLNHIAIICDGNRTWARAKGIPPMLGHREGAEAVKRLVNAATEFKIPVISLWVMGIDNFERSAEEVRWLMKLSRVYLRTSKKEILKNKNKFRLCGLRNFPAPKDIIELSEKLEEETKDNEGTTVNICFNYGGRVEILEAIKKLNDQNLEITEENLSSCLWTAGLPDPDLIIRPSNQQRLSGFMPWQSEYAEFYFPKYYFPEMNKEKLEEAIDEFYKRTRKFGKI